MIGIVPAVSIVQIHGPLYYFKFKRLKDLFKFRRLYHILRPNAVEIHCFQEVLESVQLALIGIGNIALYGVTKMMSHHLYKSQKSTVSKYYQIAHIVRKQGAQKNAKKFLDSTGHVISRYLTKTSRQCQSWHLDRPHRHANYDQCQKNTSIFLP